MPRALAEPIAALENFLNSTKRSTFVTVLAWIFIVLSSMASLVGLFQNLFLWFMPRIDMEQVMSQGGDAVPTLFLWMFGNIQWLFLFVWLMALSALVSSIGLLKRKPWGLSAFTAMLYVGILWVLSCLALMISVWVSTPAFRTGLHAGEASIMVFIAVFNFIFAAGQLGLLAWLIRRLSAPAVKAEFAQP